jgi:predicted protein tyrosine phosphatase
MKAMPPRHSNTVAFEFSKITPQIYLGTNQCCRTHFEKKLLNNGIAADISLEKEHVDAPYGVTYYLWLPTADHHAPTQKQLHHGVRFLADLVQGKEKAYVHCQHGHGRAPTIVAAYFVQTGMMPDAAFAYIRKRRPNIHPNTAQRRAVHTFARAIAKRRKA